MALFQKSNKNLKKIKELAFDLERDLQNAVEKNMESVFGLQFVSSEFQLNDLRIDSLGFDPETKSFVIIEYKRDHSFSVIDQGYAYLQLMLNNKADFILEFNEQMDANLQRGDVDWSQSRVYFVANSFTKHQLESIKFQDLPMSLWEARKYENDLISIDRVKVSGVKESINTLTQQDEAVQKVSREVKMYEVEDHFKEGWENSRESFDVLREQLLNMDPRIEEVPRKQYIAYQVNGNNVVTVHTFKSKLRIEIPRTHPDDLTDPEGRVQLRKDSMKHFNQHISQFEVKNEEDIDYIMPILRKRHKELYK